MFDATEACYLSPTDMARAVVRHIPASSLDDVFRLQQVHVANWGGAGSRISAVAQEQRDVVINGYEPERVHSGGIDAYASEVHYAVAPLCETKTVHARLMDRNAAAMFRNLRLDPAALAEIGLVVAGGCLLECAVRPRPLTRVDIEQMEADTGFDIDMFVTDAVPHRGDVDKYAHELFTTMIVDPEVTSVVSSGSGFCRNLAVTYTCGRTAKLQIVDIGVPASAPSIAASFDIPASKLWYCSRSRRVCMTPDAALSLKNRVVQFDRRFIQDPRLPYRLNKYLFRTGFSLATDEMGVAVHSVVLAVGARIRRALSLIHARDAALHARDCIASWQEEMPASDTATIAATYLFTDIVGRCSSHGYGKKRRVGCQPLTGTCGRFNIRPLGVRGDALVELHGMFLLLKIMHMAELMSLD